MRSNNLILLSIILSIISVIRSQDCQPSQIHLSPGDYYYTVSQFPNTTSSLDINNNQAYLVWHSQDLCNFTVQIKNSSSSQVIANISPAFYSNYSLDFLGAKRARSNGTYHTFAYTALFSGLDQETFYEYTILDLDSQTSSETFQFLLPSPLIQDTRKIMVVADIDASKVGMKTINALSKMAEENLNDYAGIISIGDFAYDIQDDNGTRGDNFFSALQPIAGRLPLIATHGNHDYYANWTLINLRIRDPLFNATQNQYFSLNYKGIHFVSVNFNYWFVASDEEKQKIANWVEEDLKHANLPEIKSQYPWIVFLAHIPIYCCFQETSPQPETNHCYYYYTMGKIWDELLHKYSVDLVLSAHKHSYERMGPIYQNKTAGFIKKDNDPTFHNIIDPEATVYIMDGASGNGYFMPAQYNATGYTYFVDVRPSYGLLYTEEMIGGRRIIYEHYDSETGEKIDYLNLVKSQYTVQSTMFPTQDDGGSGATILLAVSVIGFIGVLIYWYFKRRSSPGDSESDIYSQAEDKNVPLVVLKS